MRWYGLLIPMLYCDAITDAMTKGLGQQKICVRYNILTSFLDVVFLYVLLPRCGMSGYFLSFLITHLLNFALSLARLMKITGQKFPVHIPLFSAAATVLAIWAASFVPGVLMRCICYVLLLGSLLFLLQILSREDILWIKGLLWKKTSPQR